MTYLLFYLFYELRTQRTTKLILLKNFPNKGIDMLELFD
jgi:hypothetical protein